MKAVVVAHGDVDASDRDQAAGGDVVIAADGGALALERWRILPALVVGDLDSLGDKAASALAARGAKLVRHPAVKDESDTELAMRSALATGADEIVLLGLFGGSRFDHELANVMLVADPAYRDVVVRAVRGGTDVRALHAPGEITLAGAVGDVVTLLPIAGDAGGVRTRGLRYPLGGDTLPFGRSRGLSNAIASAPASVSLESGTLLVIEIREGGKT